MAIDPELKAAHDVLRIIRKLPLDARRRVADYVVARLTGDDSSDPAPAAVD